MAYVQEVAAASPPETGLVGPQDWVFRSGRWVRSGEADAPFVSLDETQDGSGDPAADDAGSGDVSPDDQSDDPFGWNRAARADMARIIAINLQRLHDGDPRMNIIIRANDIIRIPNLEVGEFYTYGRVNRPGVYSMTGRRLTVKMALAAAGNLDDLAWPSNSVLIRRIGENQEQVVPINIEKIFRNEESDIFLKPNDVIAVGTHPAAPFMAVVRNAFRFTYGFGFIYDRNFADPAPGEPNLNSARFREW
ncbi:MAG: polysaccharide biosynthesis/export family protein [Planctomycetota bacterium]